MRPWTHLTLLFAALAMASTAETVADEGAIAKDGNSNGGSQPAKGGPSKGCKPQYYDCTKHCNGKYRESCEKDCDRHYC